ncbi:hypothetical protein PUW24_24235 [Paenibacillus urinalis]|uniref:Thioredoxin domain-containing protein n=2 Tax=Paenibacillus TaxID=44249 RepID=A0ABY7X5S6_9BACL|nr:hypothetical protein [Paenibacillus urinalis]WDH97206.1 hypothetical protein PUW24_24235 [Paenibacillus urinalis]WDI00868.1 hypothetical protein PUW25_16460 [Paenibacillus urinalis]
MIRETEGHHLNQLTQENQKLTAAAHEELLHAAYRQLKNDFDSKLAETDTVYPPLSPAQLMFLMNYAKVHNQSKALEMVEYTLHQMYKSNIYDHVGHAFFTYSADEKGFVPHFKKMLNDNAWLAMTYLEAYQLTEHPLYAEIAESIFSYVLSEMTSPEGAFYAVEGDNSEGETEGYYGFTRQEIEDVLGVEEMHRYCNVYSIEPERDTPGQSIPNLMKGTPEEQAERRGLNPLALRNLLEEDRKKLLQYRETRVRPVKDNRIGTASNGLMIATLAKGAKALQQTRYADAAAQAAEFIWNKLRDDEGNLHSVYHDEELTHAANVDDYAHLAWGLMELYEATGQPAYLAKVLELKDALFRLYWDPAEGNFQRFGVSRVQRYNDNNGMDGRAGLASAGVLPLLITKWAATTQDGELKQKGERWLYTMAGAANAHADSQAMYLLGVSYARQGGRQIIISGRTNDIKVQEMISIIQKSYIPDASLIINYEGKQDHEVLAELIPGLVDKPAINGEGTVYISRDFSCSDPITSTEQLREEFKPVN